MIGVVRKMEDSRERREAARRRCGLLRARWEELERAPEERRVWGQDEEETSGKKRGKSIIGIWSSRSESMQHG
jgi:hypothetical protein